MAESRHWLDSLLAALSPTSTLSPALGSLMSTDPEAAGQLLASQGVPPPRPEELATFQDQGSANNPYSRNMSFGKGTPYTPPDRLTRESISNFFTPPAPRPGTTYTPPEIPVPPPFGGGLPAPRPGTTYTPPEVPVPPPFGRLREQFSEIGAGLGSLLSPLAGLGGEPTTDQVAVGAYNSLGLPGAEPQQPTLPPAPALAQPSEPEFNAPNMPLAPNVLATPNLLQPPQTSMQLPPARPRVASVGAPMDIRSDVQKQQDAASQQAAQRNKIGDLAKALSGLKAPEAPVGQKISSPAAPRADVRAMGPGSAIAALLAKAVAGDPQAMLTLRAAIGGGR